MMVKWHNIACSYIFFGAHHLHAIQSVRIVNYGNISILHMCYFNYIESPKLAASFGCTNRSRRDKGREEKREKNEKREIEIESKYVFFNGA